jgi:hypothetical protein
MTSVMNVSRYAKSQGWTAQYEEMPEGGFKITLSK